MARVAITWTVMEPTNQGVELRSLMTVFTKGTVVAK